MLIFILVAQRRGHAHVIVPTLAGGLALCAIAQALVLNYGFKQELYGTVDVPGGIALSPGHDNDRDTWLDDQGDEGRDIAVMPGVVSSLGPVGWHRGAAVLEQGARFHRCAPLGRNRGRVGPGRLLGCGDRAWDRRVAHSVARPAWLAAHRDDPRVQFPGRLVASSSLSRYALYRTASSQRALWTSPGLQPDGAVLRATPVGMTLDPAAAGRPPAVTLTMRAVPGATKAVRWRLTRDTRPVAAGELRPDQSREVRLRVPECQAGARCPLVNWELRSSGPVVESPLPQFGAPGAPRPLTLYLD